MSEEPPPPDLIDTDDVPRDELVSTNVIEPEVIAEALGTPATLFTDARPLGLGTPPQAESESAILEDAVRSGGPQLASRISATPPGTATLIRFGDERTPIYRRHGVLALVALGVLTLIAVISLPNPASLLESGLSTDLPPDPASGGIEDVQNSDVDGIGSEGLFHRSRSDRATIDDTERPESTKSATGDAVGEDTADTNDDADGENANGEPVDGETAGDESGDEASEETSDDQSDDQSDGPIDPTATTLADDRDVEASVVVGPDSTPAAPSQTTVGPNKGPSTPLPPAASETTVKPTTGPGSGTTATTARTTTTNAPTTTEAPATTKKPTTTEQPETTARPTTTERVTTTGAITTERPTTTEESTTTEDPATTGGPPSSEDTTTTSAAETTTSLTEDTTTSPTAVVCTEDPSPGGPQVTTIPGDPCPGPGVPTVTTSAATTATTTTGGSGGQNSD